MKLLILGGGYNQLNAIYQAKNKGYEVVVSDYLPDAPGKKIADYSELVSTFDIEGNVAVAIKHKVNGVLTIGTDQPVLTAAKVAEELNLPSHISSLTALRATNKKYMKEVFTKYKIPSAKYLLIHKEELLIIDKLLSKLAHLKFPIVVKPLDSQGQRGVFKLYNKENIIDYFKESFKFTNLNEVIVEEYFAGDELTISLWVEDFKPYILAVTDRPLLNVEPHLGIPDGHIFPSKYLKSHYKKFYSLVKQIINAFSISSGPLYIQLKVNEDVLEVIEIACRIGGGHEDELIPLISGINVIDMLIDKAAGKTMDMAVLDEYDILNNSAHAMVKFVIAKPGKVSRVGSLEEVKSSKGVINANFYNSNIKVVKELVDSTCRVGYILVKGENRDTLMKNVKKAYEKVKIYNEKGQNMVYQGTLSER